MLFACSRQHLFSTFSVESGVDPARRQEGESRRLACSRQHLFSTFSVEWDVDPARRQEGQAKRFASPRQHLFSTFSRLIREVLTVRYI